MLRCMSSNESNGALGGIWFPGLRSPVHNQPEAEPPEWGQRENAGIWGGQAPNVGKHVNLVGYYGS